MFSPKPQPLASLEGRHLLLFDGACGLCSRLVQFVLVHDHRGTFHFASLQSPAGRAEVERYGGNPEDLSTFYAVADYRVPEARCLTKARAALFVMGALGWPWKVAGLFGVLPTSLLDRLYEIVARNRYLIFGRRPGCLVPQSEFSNRFVE